MCTIYPWWLLSWVGINPHTWKCDGMFLFNSFISKNILATYPWISSYDIALDQVLEYSCPFRSDFFLCNFEWRFSIVSCRFPSLMELWESPPWILSWYLLIQGGVIYHLRGSFRCCFQCGAFLFKSLKVDGIAPSYSVAPHRGHHGYSITYTSTPKCMLISSKSVGIQYPPPLECILDNFIAITCFHCSLLEVYAFWS
jgi:hypothetical protein